MHKTKYRAIGYDLNIEANSDAGSFMTQTHIFRNG